MRTKLTALTAAGALALCGGIGYAAAGGGSAAAQPSKGKGMSMDGSMMSDDSAMAGMMDAEHAKMMRNPAMREMHRAMVREHTKMVRDGKMRRAHEQAARDFPEMARMMREHMGG